jgi:hypothetical protein
MSKFKGNGYYYIQLSEDASNESSKNKRQHFTISAGETVIAALKKGGNGISACITNPANPYSIWALHKHNFSGCHPEFAIIAAIPAAPVKKTKRAEEVEA